MLIFAVPGYVPVLIGMLNTQALNVLTINYNIKDTKTSCEHIRKKQVDSWNCNNKEQDAEAQLQCNKNTGVIRSDDTNPMEGRTRVSTASRCNHNPRYG